MQDGDHELRHQPTNLNTMAMGKKRMCGSADVATGKMRICAADIECGCVGKKRMCGCDLTFT